MTRPWSSRACPASGATATPSACPRTPRLPAWARGARRSPGGGLGRAVAFKCEYQNPSGSFKDRGSAPLLSFRQSRRAGRRRNSFRQRRRPLLQLRRPPSAARGCSSPEAAFRAQAGHSRSLRRAGGARARAALPTRHRPFPRSRRFGRGAGLRQPRLAALEHPRLCHGCLRDRCPARRCAGDGGIACRARRFPATGLGHSFQALKNAAVIDRIPRLVGVQARACAPLWALSAYGPAGLGWVSEAPTLAEGIRVSQPSAATPCSAASPSLAVRPGGGRGWILPGRDLSPAEGSTSSPPLPWWWAPSPSSRQTLPSPRRRPHRLGPEVFSGLNKSTQINADKKMMNADFFIFSAFLRFDLRSSALRCFLVTRTQQR